MKSYPTRSSTKERIIGGTEVTERPDGLDWTLERPTGVAEGSCPLAGRSCNRHHYTQTFITCGSHYSVNDGNYYHAETVD